MKELELCRTNYVQLQQSAATVSALVDEADDTEQALDDVLTSEVNMSLISASQDAELARTSSEFDGNASATSFAMLRRATLPTRRSDDDAAGRA